MPTAVQKICGGCGIDVSQQKRIKDQQGRYFCHACWSGRQSPNSQAAPVATPIAAPTIETKIEETPVTLEDVAVSLKKKRNRQQRIAGIIFAACCVSGVTTSFFLNAVTIFILLVAVVIGLFSGMAVLIIPSIDPFKAAYKKSAESFAKRSRKLAAVNQSHSPIAAPIAVSSVKTVPIAIPPVYRTLSSIGIFLAICFFAHWMWFSSSTASPTSTDSSAAVAPDVHPLPKIEVVDLLKGGSQSAANFSKWKYDGFSLTGTMVWTSGNIDAVTYTIRKDGTVIDRGNVYIPGGGFKKNEPFQISITESDLAPDSTVTIEVEE